MTDDACPAPLVPVEADLRDFAFMPLDIVRLFGSRFHAVANDGEWRAGVTLWLKSFHQRPAASIPDDDIELCRLAELGRDMKTWMAVRKVALHGWVKCSDGRLYHPVVAEKANEAWARKLAQRARAQRGNAARWGTVDHRRDEPSIGTGRGNGAEDNPRHVLQAAPGTIPEGSLKDPSRIPEGSVKESLSDPVTIARDRDRDRERESSSAAFSDSAARAREPAQPPAPQPAKILPVSSAATQVIALFDQRSAQHFGEQTRAFPAATDAVVAQRWLDAGATIALLDGVFQAKFGARKSKGKGPVGSLSYLDECVAEAIRTGSATPATPRRSGLNPSQDPAVLIRRDANGRLIQPNLNLVAG